MSDSHDNPITSDADDLWSLAEAVCTGTATAEQCERLNARLVTDEDAAIDYALYLRMHGRMLWHWRNGTLPDPCGETTNASSAVGLESGVGDEPFPVLGESSPASPPFPVLSSGSWSLASSSFVGGPSFAYLVAAAIVGIGLFIGSLISVTHRFEVVDHRPSSTPSAMSPRARQDVAAVGRITRMVDCRWEGSGVRGQGTESGQWSVVSGQKPSNDAPLSTTHYPLSTVRLGDTLALKSGLLELTYDTGARVILQGPVTYKVDSVAGGYLAVGRLTARLEKRGQGAGGRGQGVGDRGQGTGDREQVAGDRGQGTGDRGEGRGERGESVAIAPSSSSHQPLSTNHSPLSTAPNPSPAPRPSSPAPTFAVRTPTAIVTDLGTEFGVEVDRQGVTTSHVFRGSVRLETIAGGGAKAAACVLHANQSAQVRKESGNRKTIVRSIAVDADRFVRFEAIGKAEQSRIKAFQRWLAYSKKLRRDPSLMAYYDFQEKDRPSVLPNVASNADRSLDGAIQNAAWDDGRMPGKRSLRFHYRTDRVEVNLPQAVDDLTLAVWVCIDALSAPSESDVGYSALLMSDKWDIRPGELHWQVRADGCVGFTTSTDLNTYQSTPSFTSARLGRWTHVAFVYDHAAMRAVHYVNGNATDDVAIRSHGPLCIGSAWIGQWNGWDFGRNLQGRIDELAVFARALKPEEIQQMYEAGKPSGGSDGESRSSTTAK